MHKDNTPAVRGVRSLLLTVVLIASWFGMSLVTYGHGSMADPVSRVYRLYLDGPESPTYDAARAMIAVGGTQPLYDWHEVSQLVPGYNGTDLTPYRTLIPDGQLASAGRAKYAGLDLVRSDWPVTRVNPGPFQAVYYAHVPHDPSYFHAYITREGWNPAAPLTWDDLVPVSGPEHAYGEGSYYYFPLDLPQRTGRHVLYVIWQRIDPAGEAFFAACDLDFGDGTGYGNPDSGQLPVPGDGGDHGDHDSGGHGDHGGGHDVTDAAVVFALQNDWGSGYNGEIRITNNGTATINGWEVSFTYSGVIDTVWNGTIKSRDGNRYVVRNADWNGILAPGQAVAFGFTASSAIAIHGIPGDFHLNGVHVGGNDNGGQHPGDDHGDHGNDDGDNQGDPGDGDHGDHGGNTGGNDDGHGDDGGDTGHGNPGTGDGDDHGVPQAGNGVQVTFARSSSWYDGYSGTLTITNNSDAPIDGWTLTFRLDGPLVNCWSGVLLGSDGSQYSLGNEFWNGAIPVGGSVTVGIQVGSATAEPYQFAVNGTAVGDAGDDHGGQPDTDPEPDSQPEPNPEPEPEPEPQPEPGNSGLHLTVTVANDWGSGFTGEARLTNQTSASVGAWTIQFDFPHQISSLWNAVLVSRDGNRYTVRNEAWNGAIPAGGSVTFGFNAGPGGDVAQPVLVAVNGQPVDGGTTPGGNTDPDDDGQNPGGGTDEPPAGNDDGTGSEPQDPVGNGEYRIVGYFPSWGIYQKGYHVADIPAASLTHVIHAFARISINGEIDLIDPWADIEIPQGPDTWDTPLRGHFGAYRRLKAQYPHLRVMIAVGGWFDSNRFSDVAATDQARRKFAASVVDFVTRYGFDGIDLDWEYPVVATDVNGNVRPQDGRNYVLLVREIRTQLNVQELIDGKRYEISAALPAGYDKYERLELADLAAELDFINLMTYDYHGKWVANQTGHVAPLFPSAGAPNNRYNVDETILGYLAAGVPADKIVLGVPAYGYGWQGVPSPVPYGPAAGIGPGTISVEPGFYDYRTVADLLAMDPAGVTDYWDDAAQVSYYYNPYINGGLWIGYESPGALRGKIEYVRELGLGGVMFWELSTDIRDTSDPNSLIRIAAERLQ